MNRIELNNFISSYYGVEAEYPWIKHPTFAVYRHKDNKKWFAVIMELSGDKIGIDVERVNVVNLKCDPLLIGSLLCDKGIHKGYHMNKNYWITVCLDGSVNEEKIKWLLDLSFELTSKRR